MAANLSKKFELLCSCLMTMQALRLVISTAGFCVVRFHIDCSLFNIFISRLVNAVMMSQLFGNWLGDLIVFVADGTWKLIGLMLANWIEFGCFCSALICIMHTECGHLTGFYWSMVLAYFWWKVGEAPTVSIAAPDATDYYFAGFTLSGVWGSCLKGLVMWFVAETGSNSLHFHSDPLGDVNLSVVGRRSVKTTVDYRAAVWLYVITIVLTALMCLPWSVVAVVLSNKDWREGDTAAKTVVAQALEKKLKKQAGKLAEGKRDQGPANNDKNRVADKIRTLGPSNNGQVSVNDGQVKTANFGSATVEVGDIMVHGPNQVKISVHGVSLTPTSANWTDKDNEGKKESLEGKAKGALQNALIGETDLMMEKVASVNSTTITLDVKTAGVLTETTNQGVAVLASFAFGGVLAVPGAMLGAGVGWVFALCFKCCMSTAIYFKLTKWCQLILGIVGAAGGMAAGAVPCCGQAWGKLLWTGQNTTERIWVEAMKWPGPVPEWKVAVETGKEEEKAKKASWGKVGDPATLARMKLWATQLAPIMGLFVGLVTGRALGRMFGGWADIPRAGMYAGALVGSFFGLISGEMVNGAETWLSFAKKEMVGCGFFIVLSGLGTVYSIYPGMAPCSITQFKYFNIIDISILVLSSFAPLIIMGLDLADDANKLGLSIVEGDAETLIPKAKWWWCGLGLVLTIATLICEIIVLNIMQHPFSKMAKDVKTSGVLACFITIMMVSFQLTSTGIGFGCVAAGSLFNDGVNNVLSTAVLWTIECCGVLGEGYLTELKKYEPGKWPTQGMGRGQTFKWWFGRAFGNAWQIWCCIGTTDLRRDIMLCRQ